jgi:hypothetical protein
MFGWPKINLHRPGELTRSSKFLDVEVIGSVLAYNSTLASVGTRLSATGTTFIRFGTQVNP